MSSKTPKSVWVECPPGTNGDEITIWDSASAATGHHGVSSGFEREVQGVPVSQLPEGMPETVPTELVLRFVATMGLADHMGDGWNYINEFLEKAGIELKENDRFNDDTPYKRTLDEMGVTPL